MKSWDSFNHDFAYDELIAIVRQANAVGVQVGSHGARKLTLLWPDGRTIHLKRFVMGRFRWLLFTDSGCRAVFLANRDPNLSELRDATRH